MREPGIGIHDSGPVTEVRHDAVHRSQGHRTIAITENSALIIASATWAR